VLRRVPVVVGESRHHHASATDAIAVARADHHLLEGHRPRASRAVALKIRCRLRWGVDAFMDADVFGGGLRLGWRSCDVGRSYRFNLHDTSTRDGSRLTY